MNPNSVRQRLIVALINILTPVCEAAGATFECNPTVGVPREKSPALLLFTELDTITGRANDRVDRNLIIRLVALARGREAGAEADTLLTLAHRKLFVDTTLGGLALGLREIDSDWDQDDADAGANLLPTRYEIHYRTLMADLACIG